MNKEGYKTPTEDVAIGNESKREKIRKRYHIREGDIIKMRIEGKSDPGSEAVITKIVRVRIKGIYTHHVTVQLPSGVVENFQWWDFEQRRR